MSTGAAGGVGRVTAVLAVAVALVAGACGEDRDGSAARPLPSAPSPSPPPSSAPSPSTSAPSSRRSTTAPPATVDDAVALEQLVPELSAFVEAERGLRFKTPVEVTLLDDAAFRKRLDEDAREDAEELERSEEVLRAIGLLEGDGDLAEAPEGLLGEAVAGF